MKKKKINLKKIKSQAFTLSEKRLPQVQMKSFEYNEGLLFGANVEIKLNIVHPTSEQMLFLRELLDIVPRLPFNEVFNYKGK